MFMTGTQTRNLTNFSRALVVTTILAGGTSISGCTKGAAGEIKHVTLPGNDLAMTATHRLVVTGDRGNGGENIICTEPSPDAMSIVASSFALSAQVAGKGGGSVAGAFNQAAVPLFARSQTIQAIRDTVTAACLAYQNGIMPKFGYYMVIAAYPDLLIGMHAIEGITDRPLQLPGGAFAPAPAISTTLNSEEGEESQSASVTTSIAAAPAQVAEPGAPSANQLAIGKEAAAEVRTIAADHPDGRKVFTSACMMYLADERVVQAKVKTPIYEQCKIAVGALTTSMANANSESIKALNATVNANKKAVAGFQKNVDQIKALNYDINLKQAIGQFVVEDILRKQQKTKP